MHSVHLSIFLLLGVVCLVGCGTDNTQSSSSPAPSPQTNRGSAAHDSVPDLNRMPHRFGLWQGKDTPLSPEILAAVGADVVVDRLYHNPEENTQIASHMAVFSDWDTGLRHNPMVLYKATGWKLLTVTHESISSSSMKSIQVSVSEWERGNDRVVVLFWCQLGDYVLFEQSDLNKIRSKLTGKEHPPRLLKVQLQISITRPEGDRDAVMNLAGKIARWLDKPFYDPKETPIGFLTCTGR